MRARRPPGSAAHRSAAPPRRSSSSTRSLPPSSGRRSRSGRSRGPRRRSSTRTTRRRTSPILGGQVDYSLFTPRGHYMLTPALTRFFVAMSVLGQVAVLPSRDAGLPGLGARRGWGSSPRLHSLATRRPGRSGSRSTSRRRSSSASPTTTRPTRWRPRSREPLRRRCVRRPKSLGSRRRGRQASRMRSSPCAQVRINPRRASIRIMGTRFVTDELLLRPARLPARRNGGAARALLPSGPRPRVGLRLPARGQCDEGEGRADLRQLRQPDRRPTSRRSRRARPSRLGLDRLRRLARMRCSRCSRPHGSAFPDYMRSDAWAAKDLQSGLGSYTELKHDTILFAKQLVAEAGGDFSKRNPLNWVEPDPVAFERLAAGADLMQRGLARRGLLTHEAAGLLGTEIGLLRFLGSTARTELAGKPISAADNKRLRSLGDELERDLVADLRAVEPRSVDPRPVGRRRRHRDLAERDSRARHGRGRDDLRDRPGPQRDVRARPRRRLQLLRVHDAAARRLTDAHGGRCWPPARRRLRPAGKLPSACRARTQATPCSPSYLPG